MTTALARYSITWAPIPRALVIRTLSIPSHPSYTSIARSSTFPKPALIARSRLCLTESHLQRASTFGSAKPINQVVSGDLATCKPRGAHIVQTPVMTSQNEPFVRKECLMCKRKLEDEPSEEKATKIAKKDTTVDIDAEIEDKFNQLPPLPASGFKQHPRFVHCMPPEAPTYREYSVFLAGSIEMGKAVQWQQHMAKFLSPLPITVNNPRRGNWNPRATQEAKNEAFRHQVEWELSALEKADVICFFLDVNTMSPVTMLELGLWAKSNKVVVCCNKKFWRAGNIHIVCDRYKIPFVETFEDLVPSIKGMLEEKGMKLDDNNDLIE